MSSWNYGGSSSSNPIEDEPVIPDIVEEFTSDDFYEDNADDQEIVLVPTMDYNPYGEFDSKEATVSAIKHYHITNGYNFNVVESKPHIYVARCIHYNNGCQWRLRARWLLAAQQTNPGTTFQLSGPPVNVDAEDETSTYIMERCFWAFGPCIEDFKYCKLVVQVDGTFLTGKYHATLLTTIAQDGNRNIFPLAFAIVEEAREFCQPYDRKKLTGNQTIFTLSTTYVNVDAEDETSTYIMERCFWAFGPCIEGFKYCKPVVQVDGTFLTGKYHATLLTTIAQDGNRNIFPLAFAIVEAYEVKQPTVQAKLSAMRSQFP
ncbi:uncharacterized protein LOC114165407 [Vigna unguiculata]|uniref:uncharacterized protein LOC114165407 n=1 Tax=Vigna unguiculata TaxID=3917 RepID=UPI001016D202|nr:uncharacterized protein LOC114165407 [Vigna unguiculata]